MKQDDLRGKIMNEVKSQIRGIVNEEVAKINTKQRLKDKIKPLVAEELKRMVNEDRDYAKLQELIWVDGSSGRGDEIEGTAIEIVGCDDVVSVLEYVLESISYCSRS